MACRPPVSAKTRAKMRASSSTINLKGQRFGRLLVLCITKDRALDGSVCWKCRCDCGEVVIVIGGCLRKHQTQSCGCLRNERVSEANTTHGHCRPGSITPTYKAWGSMKDRCARDPAYKGIVKVCKRWHNFENFLADMGEKPPGLTLDRYPDPDGDYEPSNCRWATWLQQRHNWRSGAKRKVS